MKVAFQNSIWKIMGELDMRAEPTKKWLFSQHPWHFGPLHHFLLSHMCIGGLSLEIQ